MGISHPCIVLPGHIVIPRLPFYRDLLGIQVEVVTGGFRHTSVVLGYCNEALSCMSFLYQAYLGNMHHLFLLAVAGMVSMPHICLTNYILSYYDICP